MHLFVNATAATAGGGITYLRNVVSRLAASSDLRATVALPPGLRGRLAEASHLRFVEARPPAGGSLARFLWEQATLPGLIRDAGADVLISAGNFALFRSPVPQVLLARNALYTTPDFDRDLRARGEQRLRLDNAVKKWLARRSVRRAECTVTPTRAFADEIRSWARPEGRVETVPHGFDPAVFFGSGGSLGEDRAGRLRAAEGSVSLLFVSHYNYFRNFETLLRGLALLRRDGSVKGVKLVLTCELRPKPEWGEYDATGVRNLVRDLAVAGDVVELGLVPYEALHLVYRSCQLYVTASYAESFAHPLVEAMACGLPVVASDIPVHREVCGDAALYFPRFSPEGLAAAATEVIRHPELSARLGKRGERRAGEFTWEGHVRALVAIAADLLSPGRAASPSFARELH